MSLLSLILALVVVGIVLYCINRFVPMDGKIKTILNVVVILVLVVWLLNVFGLLNWMDRIPVTPRGR
jgi:hypothetical protein